LTTIEPPFMPKKPKVPSDPVPAPDGSASDPAAEKGTDWDKATRYDANLKLIRRRLADEDRMKDRRRGKLP
jgi:hypothetical protein